MGQGQTEPQQPELDRRGLGDVDPDQPKVKQDVWGRGRERGRAGRTPQENRPGHHPAKEQDKPGAPSTAPKESRDTPG